MCSNKNMFTMVKIKKKKIKLSTYYFTLLLQYTRDFLSFEILIKKMLTILIKI